MAVKHAAEMAVLADHFQHGDQNALREVLRDVCPGICAALERRFPQLAAEIEHIVCAAVWQCWCRRSKYDPARGTFDAWLYAIAYRGCLSFLRREARRFELSTDPDALARLSDPHGDAYQCDRLERQAGDEDDASPACKIVRGALATLGQSQRSVLTADGDSPGGRAPTHELAVELGVTDSGIRKARTNGLKRLKSECLRRGIKKILRASRAEHITYRETSGDQNGERRTENAERRTQNGERRTENGERRTENGSDHNRGALSPARGGRAGRGSTAEFFISEDTTPRRKRGRCRRDFACASRYFGTF